MTGDDQRSRVASARAEAIAATVAELYGTPALRDTYIAQALDNWDNITEGSLRTAFSHEPDQALVDAEIERIRQELLASQRPGAAPLDAETFVRLPAVKILISQLEDKLAVSPNEIRSGE